MIDHPPHYNHGKFEHAEVAIDWKLGGLLYNCTKYICRARHKGDPREDLHKGLWYLEREIALLKTGEEFGLACVSVKYDPSEVSRDWKLSPKLASALWHICMCISIEDIQYLEAAVDLISAEIDLLTP